MNMSLASSVTAALPRRVRNFITAKEFDAILDLQEQESARPAPPGSDRNARYLDEITANTIRYYGVSLDGSQPECCPSHNRSWDEGRRVRDEVRARAAVADVDATPPPPKKKKRVVDPYHPWVQYTTTRGRQDYHAVPRPWSVASKEWKGMSVGVELEIIAQSWEKMEEISREAGYYALLPETDPTLPDNGVELTSRPYSAKRWLSGKHKFFEFVGTAVAGNIAIPKRDTDQGFHVNISWPEYRKADGDKAARYDAVVQLVDDALRYLTPSNKGILFGREFPYGYINAQDTHIELKSHRSCDNPELLREYVATTVGLGKLIEKAVSKGMSYVDIAYAVKEYCLKRVDVIREKFYADGNEPYEIDNGWYDEDSDDDDVDDYYSDDNWPEDDDDDR